MTGLFELIKSLPVILQTLLELKKLWDQFLETKDRQAAMAKLGDAFKVARETKDTGQIEKVLRDIIAGNH